MDEDAPRADWQTGKHWHPSTGWTNHGEAACRATVRDSEVLADLRAILAKHRAQLAKRPA